MMDIKIFTNRGAEEWMNFFLHITILFHQCNNKYIYQQFFVVYIIHFTHTAIPRLTLLMDPACSAC